MFNMGVLAVGQIVSSEDVLKMDGYVDPTVALLSGLSIYYVQDAGSAGPTGGDIEDEAFLALADYLAMKAAVAFNLGDDAKLTALGLKAESDLRTISAAPRTAKPRKKTKTAPAAGVRVTVAPAAATVASACAVETFGRPT